MSELDISIGNLSNYSNDIYLEEWKSILQVTISERVNWLRVLLEVGMLVSFVAGLSGNVVTCVVIFCDRSMHTATNYYLFNLAVSDLLASFGVLIELSWYNPYYINFHSFGDTICKIYFFLIGVLWNNSVLTIVTLAIERFIVIWYPLLLNKEHEWCRVKRIIIFIWVVAIMETIPEIFTVNLIETRQFFVCFIVPTPFAKQLNGLLGLVTFIIPLGIMILTYTMVGFKVNVTQTSCNYSGSHIFNHRNNSSKVNKLIMALTVSFMVCWLPFFGMRIVIYTMDVPHRLWFLQNWALLLMLTSFNSWFSIVLNPLLFSLMSTKFRKAFKALWNTKFKRRRPRQVNIPV